MNYIDSFLLILAAGIMNGSFVVPSRYCQGLSNNRIWFYHAIIGMLLLPWLIMLIIAPNFFQAFSSVSATTYSIIILGGLCFGLGQITFAKSINDIGLSLSFPINIGLGLIIGSMYVVVSRHVLWSHDGLLVSSAVIMIMLALLMFYLFRKSHEHSQKHYQRGWILAGITGLTSGLQNITFVLTATQGMHLSTLAKMYWVWPIFLTAAALPMLIGFYKLSQQDHMPYQQPSYKKNMLMITLMGIGFTGSLVCYSLGMEYLNHIQQIIGWPVFMAAIILTCQLWGWYFDEYHALSKRFKRGNSVGIALLIIAIIVLALK